jgi:hypothetical protein
MSKENKILLSVYQQFDLDEGFQGCIHKLLINNKQVMFNYSDHIAQNIGLILN